MSVCALVRVTFGKNIIQSLCIIPTLDLRGRDQGLISIIKGIIACGESKRVVLLGATKSTTTTQTFLINRRTS